MTKKQMLAELRKIEQRIEKIGVLQCEADEMATDLLERIDPEDETETRLQEVMYHLQDALSCYQTGWKVEELIEKVRDEMRNE